jgi:CO dehydrogenase/acetyl-CoA synthase alpha subunit
MRFEKVLDGIARYLDRELYVGLNDWQEMIARIAVSRVIGNKEQLKTALSSNPYLQTFAVIDNTGEVDAETLLQDIKTYITAKGKMSVTVPMMGTFTFKPEDVDKLRQYMEG